MAITLGCAGRPVFLGARLGLDALRWALKFRRKMKRQYATYREYAQRPSVEGLARSVFTTIINFDKDYLGQKEVILSRRLLNDEPKISYEDAEAHWIRYLRNRKTRIQTIYAFDVSQELLDAIAEQPQIKKIVIQYPEFSDLSVLQKMPHLEYLELDQCASDLDFEPLVKCKSLRVLHIFARKTLNFDSVGKITQLEGLWFGTGIDPGFDNKWVKVDNLNFLRNLKNLKRLLFDVKPLDLDLSPALSLDNLEEAWYVYFRGQFPSVEDMAKAHPAFVKVYENYLGIKSGNWKPIND
jgi:hypothetical protein